MKIADITAKTTEELREMLKEQQLKLGKLSFERQSKTLKKSSDIGKTRKMIAQIKTILWNQQ